MCSVKNIYTALNRLLTRSISALRVLDLRLKGAQVPWGTFIGGKVRVVNAGSVKFLTGVKIGGNVSINASGGVVKLSQRSVLAANVRIDAMGGDVVIGSDVLINTNTIITSWSGVSIGSDALIVPFCHITDRDHGLSKDFLIRKQAGESSPIEIGEDVWMASSCIVLKGVKIGNGAVIGANSVVNNDVGEYEIAAGSPVKVIGIRDN